MAKKKVERTEITKTDWKANFSLVGTPKITDFTFKMNEHSSKNSTYTYNRMHLGVDCGDNGIVYCDMMGGFDMSKPYPIRKASKDDPSKMIEVAWEDRLSDDTVNSIADFAKITVALRKTDEDKVVYKTFLHEYDAIEYIKQYLTDKDIVRVSGTLKWSMYNDKMQVSKQVNRIVLVKGENPKIGATFTQSVLLDKDSIDTKSIDYEKNCAFLSTRLLDYVKMIDDVEINGQYPYKYTLELRAPSQNALNAILNRYCKVKKNITQINFTGAIFEGGAKTAVTVADLPTDLQQDIKDGIITEKDAFDEYAAVTRGNSSNETRLIAVVPAANDSEGGRAVYPNRYTEEDLSLDWLYQDDEEVVKSSTAVESVDVEDNFDFLNDMV